MSAESIVFQFVVQKYDQDIQNYNIACFDRVEGLGLPYWGRNMGWVFLRIGCWWPKRDAVTGEWRRLHNEVPYALYSSPNIIRVIKSGRMRSVGHLERMGDRRGAYRVLVGIPEGKRLFWRPGRRWEDNIKLLLSEFGWGACTGLIWLRVWAGGGRGSEPSGYIKCETFFE